jgi:hypothetical protein
MKIIVVFLTMTTMMLTGYLFLIHDNEFLMSADNVVNNEYQESTVELISYQEKKHSLAIPYGTEEEYELDVPWVQYRPESLAVFSDEFIGNNNGLSIKQTVESPSKTYIFKDMDWLTIIISVLISLALTEVIYRLKFKPTASYVSPKTNQFVYELSNSFGMKKYFVRGIEKVNKYKISKTEFAEMELVRRVIDF